MRFAKIWFAVAGWWGILSLTPLFFFYNLIGLQNPPAITHPEYYFGFLAIALAWQFGFLVLSRDPVRYRGMMLPAAMEKIGYAFCCFVLVARHLSAPSVGVFGALDLVFGLGFLFAFRNTEGHRA